MNMQGFINLSHHIYNDHSPYLQQYMRNFLAEIKDVYELDDNFIRNMCIACELHDIGKMSIPISVIRHKGRLSTRQMDKMEMHPIYGWRIFLRNHPDLTDCDNDLFMVCKNTILCHHERNNGYGYPYGLVEEHIPFEGKLMAIVDSYDALTIDRCYRRKYSSEEAIEILRSDDGYCQELVEYFVASLKKGNDQLEEGI